MYNLKRYLSSRSVMKNPVDLEKIDVDIYRSTSLWMPLFSKAVFGGQVCGQALAASSKCINGDKVLHSMHSYFMKAGNPQIPILYHVKKLNITNNFEVHNISANQSGETIFTCQASYQRPEKSILCHERKMPEAPDPETISTRVENLQRLIDDDRIPEQYKIMIQNSLKFPFPIDVREINPPNLLDKPKSRKPRKLVWMKALIEIDEHDTNLHNCLAAYASDWGLGNTSLLPHAIPFNQVKLLTSLDHSMWFHSPFRADQWLLFDMKSVTMSGGRGMNIGYVYRQDGTLAITTAQETLIRLNPDFTPADQQICKV